MLHKIFVYELYYLMADLDLNIFKTSNDGSIRIPDFFPL